jgi:hypothetical protein
MWPGGDIRNFWKSGFIGRWNCGSFQYFKTEYFTSFGHFKRADLITFEKTVNSSFIPINTTVMEDVLWILTLKNKNNETYL